MIRILMLLAVLMTGPARAEEIVLGLSQDEVAITATFEGSEILVFGAIKRETAEPDGDLAVIVTVAGPDAPVTVRRKARRLGIWVNTDAVQIEQAPSFYAVASSGVLRENLRASEDLNYRITLPSVIRDVSANVMDSPAFEAALMRIRSREALYQRLDNAVDLSENTLFRTAIRLPANLTEGNYRTRIFLTRNGTVVDSYETEIIVNKVGLERWLYDLAHDNALLYGLMSLAIAIAAGWGASALFGLLRR